MTHPRLHESDQPRGARECIPGAPTSDRLRPDRISRSDVFPRGFGAEVKLIFFFGGGGTGMYGCLLKSLGCPEQGGLLIARQLPCVSYLPERKERETAK